MPRNADTKAKPNIVPIYRDGELVGMYNRKKRTRLDLKGNVIAIYPPPGMVG